MHSALACHPCQRVAALSNGSGGPDLGAWYDVFTAPGRAVLHVAEKAARAVGLGPVVDKLAEWAEDATSWAADEVEDILEDPDTWIVVAAAVTSVLTLGTAAPEAATMAAQAIAARNAPKILKHATKDATRRARKEAAEIFDSAVRGKSAKDRQAVHMAVREYNPRVFDQRMAVVAAHLAKDPRFPALLKQARLALAAELAIKGVKKLPGLVADEKALRHQAEAVYARRLLEGDTLEAAAVATGRAVEKVRRDTSKDARAAADREPKLKTPEQQAKFVVAYRAAVIEDGKSPADAQKSALREVFVPSKRKTFVSGEYKRELDAAQNRSPSPASPPSGVVLPDNLPQPAPEPAPPPPPAEKSNNTMLIVAGLAGAAGVAYLLWGAK